MTIWIEPNPVNVPEEISAQVRGHPIIAETIVRRGISLDQVPGYLDPAKYQPASAYELPGMDAAVMRVQQAVQAGETICVWGDFDVDGQTATTLLVEGLKALGGTVFYHIPVRETESHGINIPKLKEVIERGATLIVTCDTGIAEHEPLAYARSVGVDVVVTDHHSLPETLPQAVALVNSQMVPSTHPLRTLPGVGVAYKLIEALYEQAGMAAETIRLLDLVALGIVADLAGLRGDTRYLLQKGLEVLRTTERVGLQALYEEARINAVNLNEETIGFAIGPRMNALGRLDDANPIVEFLTTEDKTLAKVTASRLEGMNEERRHKTEQIFEGAVAQLSQDPALARYKAIVLAQENWEAGIIGIVASRLVEQYNKPAILIALADDGMGRGSARSVEGINITEAIKAQHALLNTYGGHPMAAGLSLAAENIEQFRKDISRTISQAAEDTRFEQEIEIGGYLDFGEISVDLLADLDRLGPFGAGNPSLTFAARNVQIRNSRKIGRNKNHLRLVVESQPDVLHEVLWWRADEEDLPEGRFDLAFSLRMNDFKGERQVQAVWVDARPVVEDTSSGESRGRGKVYEIVDWRSGVLDMEHARGLQKDSSFVFWGEAESVEGINFVQRDDLFAAENLVIWTIPPDLDVLRKALAKVNPTRLYLCGNLPGARDAKTYLGRMAGLLKATITQKQGKVTLRRLAGAVAQSEQLVIKSLDWFRAAGHFDYEITGRSVILSVADGKTSENRQLLREEITRLLAETNAFRRSYLKADPVQLLGKRRK